MSRKIYGVTVGTTTSPKLIEKTLKPVKTVNGSEPDENGNVQVGGSAEAVQANLDAHTGNKKNPHGVTAEQVGARPDTWTPTAEEVGARPDNWMPNASDVKAAPAGYGLGESDHNIPANGSITIRFNSQRHIALIAVQGSHMNNRSVFVVNTYGSGGVRTHIKRLCGEDTILYGILPESADNTNGIVLFNQSTDGYVSASILILFGAYPEVTNGNSGVTAEPFEWENPPMIPGEEYRTTERWNGKPVYVKAVYLGALTNGLSRTFPEAWQHGAIRVTANCNGYLAPYYYGSTVIFAVNAEPSADGVKVSLYSNGTFDGIDALVTLWYTKN